MFTKIANCHVRYTKSIHDIAIYTAPNTLSMPASYCARFQVALNEDLSLFTKIVNYHIRYTKSIHDIEIATPPNTLFMPVSYCTRFQDAITEG